MKPLRDSNSTSPIPHPEQAAAWQVPRVKLTIVRAPQPWHLIRIMLSSIFSTPGAGLLRLHEVARGGERVYPGDHNMPVVWYGRDGLSLLIGYCCSAYQSVTADNELFAHKSISGIARIAQILRAYQESHPH